jgi:hypothetical protein
MMIKSKGILMWKRAGIGLAVAAGLLASPLPAEASLTFQCVEPSRYVNILPIFNDDPNAYFDYFRLAPRQLPNLQSCRALIINGTIATGDAEILLKKIAEGKGGLAVLYVAFDGTDLVEEAKMASIVRAFFLKTKAVRGPGFAYAPDFGSRWHEPVALARTAGISPAAVAPFSLLDSGLQRFSARKDLRLPVAKEHGFCLEGCWAVWFAGINRTRSASQAPAPPASATSPGGAVTRQRALVSRFIDTGRWPAGNDPVLQRAPSGAPFWTAASERILRTACNAELSVVQSLESSLSQAFDAAANKKFDPGSVEGLTSLFERFNRAGARIEQCYAVADERERYASFRRQCPSNCDQRALNSAFSKQAEKILLDASQIQ